MRINLSNVTSMEPLPEGQYNATLSERKTVLQAHSSGKPYVALTFTVQDEPYVGRKLWRNLSLQEQSFWAVKQALVRLGVDEDVINDPDGFDTDEVFGELIGAPCVLDVGIREYNGEPRNEVKAILEPDAGRVF